MDQIFNCYEQLSDVAKKNLPKMLKLLMRKERTIIGQKCHGCNIVLHILLGARLSNNLAAGQIPSVGYKQTSVHESWYECKCLDYFGLA